MANYESDTPKIVVLGGGTGLSTIARGLKPEQPRVIVGMADNGKHTKEMRQLGIFATGDIRKNLIALADHDLLKLVFGFRYRTNSEDRHNEMSVGNIILGALQGINEDDKQKAINDAHELLRVSGRVIPASLEEHDIAIEEDGQVVYGEEETECYISKTKNPKVYLDPEVDAHPEAVEAIGRAGVIVFAPGSKVGSRMAPLLPRGMSDAIAASSAKKVFISNLVSANGQVEDVVDEVESISRTLGEDPFDYVLYNTLLPSKEVRERYYQDGMYPLTYSEKRLREIRATVIGDNFLVETTDVEGLGWHSDQPVLRHDFERVHALVMMFYYSHVLTGRVIEVKPTPT